jgi:Ca2+-binding RTX toxin-like protein
VTLAYANDASVALVQFSGTVNGGSGSDSIQVGGATTATIAGGAGHDTFVFQSSGVTGSAAAPYLAFDATITDFTVGEDRIAFHFAGVSNFEDFMAILATVRQVGTDVVATTIMGDRLTLTGVELSDLTTDLFTFT